MRHLVIEKKKKRHTWTKKPYEASLPPKSDLAGQVSCLCLLNTPRLHSCATAQHGGGSAGGRWCAPGHQPASLQGRPWVCWGKGGAEKASCHVAPLFSWFSYNSPNNTVTHRIFQSNLCGDGISATRQLKICLKKTMARQMCVWVFVPLILNKTCWTIFR